MKPISASQVKLSFACMARWGLSYLAEEKEPPSPSTELGSLIHKELEEWLTKRVMPKHRIALAALPYAPTPASALVERPIHLQTESSLWRGFVDVQTIDGFAIASLERLREAERTTIQDWKTTSSLEWALDEAGLRKDIQANLYAYESFVSYRAKAVTARWVYLPTKGACRPKPVEVKMDRNETLDFVDGKLDTQAGELQRLYQLRPKWTELPKNTASCYSYGRQCPGYDRCKPQPKLLLHEDTYMDFKDAMASKFPTLPVAPPLVPVAPPLVPAAPPLVPVAPPLVPVAPPLVPVAPRGPTPRLENQPAMLSGTSGYREAVALPVPEAGFVNPPEAPKVAATSPEHAAALQGAQPSVQDELDGLTRDQLKAVAVLEGAEPENTRKRESALRDSIRQFRSIGGGGPLEAKGHPTPPPVITRMNLNGDAEAEAVELQPPPLVPRTSKNLLNELQEHSSLSSTQANGTNGYVLYLGCSPVGREVVNFSSLVALANAQICAEQNVRDYRLIGYGGGPGMLSAIVSELLELYHGAEIVAELCPSTSACMDVLISKASRVVRAFS